MAHAAGAIVRVGHDKAPGDSASVYARHHAQDALRRSVAALQRQPCWMRAPDGTSAANRTLATQAPLASRTRHAPARTCIAASSRSS
ncbi:hypothetical protein XAPC_1569 [Xanthomonas citri pv. punicae str. LMG 859]|nr:hypothetical protein XAPC_1569 [Xanthomonas citri pv. punicae str. LMG 859]